MRDALKEIREETRNALARKTAVEQVRIIEAAKRRELNGKLDNPPQPTNGEQPTAAGTIAAAPSLTMPNKIELPKVDPKIIAQGAIALGEIALPAGAVAQRVNGELLVQEDEYEWLKEEFDRVGLKYKRQRLKSPFVE